MREEEGGTEGRDSSAPTSPRSAARSLALPRSHVNVEVKRRGKFLFTIFSI